MQRRVGGLNMGRQDRPYIFRGKLAHFCGHRGDITCRYECQGADLRRSRRRTTSKARRAAARLNIRQGV